MRAIHLYCDLVSGAVLDGLQAELAGSGADIGEQEEPPVELPPAVEASTAGSQEEQATA
jgi:small subunit ribosomal protein S2